MQKLNLLVMILSYSQLRKPLLKAVHIESTTDVYLEQGFAV